MAIHAVDVASTGPHTPLRLTLCCVSISVSTTRQRLVVVVLFPKNIHSPSLKNNLSERCSSANRQVMTSLRDVGMFSTQSMRLVVVALVAVAPLALAQVWHCLMWKTYEAGDAL